jgi:TonB family protein
VFARTPNKLDPSYGLSICAHLCFFAFLYAVTPGFDTQPQIIVYHDSYLTGGGGLDNDAIAEVVDPAGAAGPLPVRMRRSMSSSLADFIPMRAHELPVQSELPDITLTLRRPLFEQSQELAEIHKRTLARLERSKTASVDALEVAGGFRSSEGLLPDVNASGGENGSHESAGDGSSGGEGLAQASNNGTGSDGGRGTGSGGASGAWHGKFPGIGEGNSPPRYPREALAAGREGVVRLRVRVSATGTVEALRIEISSGDSSLDNAALTAVREWQFKPAERGGVPVAAEVVVPVRFAIRAGTLSEQFSVTAS